MCCVLWYFTLQWPGRAASFESQGSCPSPKPPQTPWRSQVERWHHLCKKADVCIELLGSRVAYQSLVSMLYENPSQRVSYMFLQVVLKLFLFIHSSSSSALQRWLCTAFTVIQFKFSTRLLWNSQKGFICQTFSQTTWMVGLTARTRQWFTHNGSTFSIFWATLFWPKSSLVSKHFTLKWHKAKGLRRYPLLDKKKKKKQSINPHFGWRMQVIERLQGLGEPLLEQTAVTDV